MFRLLWSEAFTNDFKIIVSGASFLVNNKIVPYIDAVKAMEYSENLNQISAQYSFFQAE